MQDRGRELEVVADVGDISLQASRCFGESDLAFVTEPREHGIAVTLEDAQAEHDHRTERHREHDSDEQERSRPHPLV